MLATTPFVGMPIGPVVDDGVHPLLPGMPFPLGWITVWVVLAAIVMAGVYAVDPAKRQEEAESSAPVGRAGARQFQRIRRV